MKNNRLRVLVAAVLLLGVLGTGCVPPPPHQHPKPPTPPGGPSAVVVPQNSGTLPG